MRVEIRPKRGAGHLLERRAARAERGDDVAKGLPKERRAVEHNRLADSVWEITPQPFGQLGEREPLWTHLPEHAEHGRGPQQPVERGRVTSRELGERFHGPGAVDEMSRDVDLRERAYHRGNPLAVGEEHEPEPRRQLR